MAKKPEQAKGGIVSAVEQLITPVVEEMGLRVWDVRFEKEGPDWYLRIYLDRDTALDMNACEAAARAINPIIDAADPIEQSYYMEVGSPGLGRRLTKDAHFEALCGQKVLAHLIRPGENGVRDVSGVLIQKSTAILTLMTDAGQTALDMASVSYVKLCDDEDLF